jgi:hypothetical protein
MQNYSAENIKFITAVDKFRDSLKVTTACWTKSWKDIDKEMNNTYYATSGNQLTGKISKSMMYECTDEWKPGGVCRDTIIDEIYEIWNIYISNSGEYQICIPSAVLHRTLFRIQHFALYGPDVFTEATDTPAETIIRDIMPRFRQTNAYKNMLRRCEEIRKPKNAFDLKVSIPNNDCLSDLQSMPNDYTVTLNDCINCGFLYSKFLDYLTSIFSSDNLLCVRMLHIYKAMKDTEPVSDVEEMAWTIYQYFVVPGSPCEISLRGSAIQDISLNMATLPDDIFVELYRSAMRTLTECFVVYQRTCEYAQLLVEIRRCIITHKSRKHISTMNLADKLFRKFAFKYCS